MNFNTWLRQIGKSQKTADHYSRAITGVISQWAIQAGLTTKNLSDVGSLMELQEIAANLQNVQIYKERNEKGKGMYRCALNAYVAYRQRETPEVLEQDVEAILTDENLAPTEKSTYISARVGQGRYRKDLIGFWEGCAVTGYSDVRLLVASHIKPWRTSDNIERLDTYNGLLLLPNLDKAFDLGFITFTEQGRIIVSNQLEDAGTLGIESSMRIQLKEPHQPYMAYHREKVFESLS